MLEPITKSAEVLALFDEAIANALRSRIEDSGAWATDLQELCEARQTYASSLVVTPQ